MSFRSMLRRALSSLNDKSERTEDTKNHIVPPLPPPPPQPSPRAVPAHLVPPPATGSDDARHVRVLEAQIDHLRDALREQSASAAHAQARLATHALCVSELHAARQTIVSLQSEARELHRLHDNIAALQATNAQLVEQLSEAVVRIYELEGASVVPAAPAAPADAAEEEEETRGEGTCVVELDQIRPGDSVFRLPCFHVHHTNCLLAFLKEQDAPECPICRTPVAPEDLDVLPMWTLE